MNRQPRVVRRRGIRVDLQARDVELLHALARLRIARTSDLAALCFPGVRRDTMAARLRILFDAGYLDVFSPERASENVYSLGPRGRDVLRRAQVEFSPVPRGGLAHHLGIVRTWVAIVSGLPPGVTPEVVRADWELRGEFGGQLAIVPDLFVVLNVGGSSIPLALEVDLATEPHQVLRRKVQAYADVLSDQRGLFGWEDFGLAIALGDERRRDSVEGIIRQEWDGWWLCWTLGAGPRELFGHLTARV